MAKLVENMKNILAHYEAEIVECGCDNLCIIKTSANKYGIITDTGGSICKPEYDEIYFKECPYYGFDVEEYPYNYPFCIKSFSNGMKAVYNINGDGYGYIDLNNNFTKYRFYPNTIYELGNEYICFEERIIDIYGQIIFSTGSSFKTRRIGNLIVVDYGSYAIIFPDKTILLFKKDYNKIDAISSPYPITFSDRTIKYISFYKKNGNKTILKLNENNMSILVDEELRPCLPNYYVEILEFSDDGYANVRSVDGWGKINEKFEEIIPTKYTWVSNFMLDWAYVEYYIEGEYKFAIRNINGKEIELFDYLLDDKNRENSFHEGMLIVCHPQYGYGFIDENGDEVIKCKYHSVENFIEGVAKVRYDTEFGYINKRGELLIKSNSNTIALSSKYDWGWICEFGFIKVQKGNLYGLLNEKCEEIIPCLFEKLEVLSENKILVEKTFYETNSYSRDLWGRHKTIRQRLILDKKGHFVLNIENSNMSLVINEKYDWIYPFHDGIAKIEKNGRWGFINQIGKEIVLFEKDVKVYDFSSGLALIVNSDKRKHFYINKRGNSVIAFDGDEYEDIIAYSFMNDFAIIRLNEKYGMIDTRGRTIIPFEYDLIDVYDKKTGLIKVGKATEEGIKKGFCNATGDIVVPCEYVSISSISNRNDLFIVEYNSYSSYIVQSYCKIINNKGDVVVPIDFKIIKKDIYDEYGGGMAYENSSKSTVLNCDILKQEKVVFKSLSSNKEITFVYRIDNTYLFATTDAVVDNYLNLKSLDIYVKYVIRGMAIVSYTNKKEKMLGINTTACKNLYDLVHVNNISNANPQYTILPDEFKRLEKTLSGESANQIKHKIIIDNNHKYGYSDNIQQITPIYDEALPFNGDRASVKMNNKWGSIDLEGHLVVPCIYDEPMFYVNEVAIVKLSSKYGFVRKDGCIISKCIYDEVRNFNERMAAIRIGNFWGYIDDSGKQILKCKYRKANDFSDGLALVSIDWGENCFINKVGDIVINCKGMYDISNFNNGVASAIISVARPGKDDIDTVLRKGARFRDK